MLRVRLLLCALTTLLISGCGSSPRFPIVLKGTSNARDEVQMGRVRFAREGELVIVASASRWAEDTSIGLQLWHPDEDGIVFRGGNYLTVKGGAALVNEALPEWSVRGKHTYKIKWGPDQADLYVDKEHVATVGSASLPSRPVDFRVRFNADYDDVLHVYSCKGWYTTESGSRVTVSYSQRPPKSPPNVGQIGQHLRALWAKVIDNVIATIVALAVSGTVVGTKRKWYPALRRAAVRTWDWALIILHIRHVETEEDRLARERQEMLISEDEDVWRPL